jgi:RNA polymerase sigma-70 factor (ECF subfamily)
MIDNHGKLLRHLVSSYEANLAVQQELFQDIALAIWTALPNYRQQANERTFLARIAHNRLATHVDKSIKRVKTEPYEQAVHDEINLAVSMDETFAAQQRVRHLLMAVRLLRLDDRQLVSLALEGFSYQEVADVLGLSVNVVGVRLNRAKAHLKRLLESADE